MPEKIYLRQMQALPLIAKVHMSQQRIREWYDHFDGNVYISFSGGKDSTVLAHVVHEYYPDVPLVFCNTGLEYPEVQAFAKKMGAEFIRPRMSFSEVISKYGYPIIGKVVSEAIHYARLVIPKDSCGGGYNKEGVVYHYERSRAELSGTRDDTERIASRKNRMAKSKLDGSYATAQINVGGGTENSVNSSVTGIVTALKSMFNKRKWLELCDETDFRISHKCCAVMKKSPLGIYQRKNKVVPFIGTLASESRLREQAWVRHGCNAYEGTRQSSQPLSFWTEQDILKYLYMEGWEIASVYGDIVGVDKNGFEYEPLPGVDCQLKCTGCDRTGCVFCGFGCHLEKGETRFQRLAKTHPKQYEYCMNGGQYVDNPDYDPFAPKMDGEWKNWNPKKIWVPSKEGLGMKKVFDDCNQLYGKDFIRYE